MAQALHRPRNFTANPHRIVERRLRYWIVALVAVVALIVASTLESS